MSSPTRLIVDTDIFADCDDAGAIALANTFHNTGEAQLLAVLVNSPSRYGAAAVHAINRFYRNGDVPVGALKPVDDSVFDSDYARSLADGLGDPSCDGSNAPEAVDVYRKVLASQPNGSVTISSIGFLTNLSKLLASGPDRHSSLSGEQLVASKVNRLVVMGGVFPTSKDRSEFNFAGDIEAAQHVANAWPTTQVFSGWELGADVYTGGRLTIMTDESNPVRQAYERFVGPRAHRHSWDLLTVYYAVRGNDGLMKPHHDRGRCLVEEDGSNTWQSDPDGMHQYLEKEAPVAEIGRSLESLLVMAPQRERILVEIERLANESTDPLPDELRRTVASLISEARESKQRGDDVQAVDHLRALLAGLQSSGLQHDHNVRIRLENQIDTYLSGNFFKSSELQFVPIQPGSYERGSEEGFPNEMPVHQVALDTAFEISATPITNAQYEAFDPDHARLRNRLGWSRDDDEAAAYVSWDEAMGFAEWLSAGDGHSYRLPTEAEWEYVARAGMSTPFATGADLPTEYHLNQNDSWFPGSERGHGFGSLAVGMTAPNAWGVHDMHGLVEEWTLDWYGPYSAGAQLNPAGPDEGDFKVTRGGSHSTTLPYLRSACRTATVPSARNWLTGFRVVRVEKRDGLSHLSSQRSVVVAKDRRPARQHTSQPSDPGVPFFMGPRWFMRLKPSESGPFGNHNHQPAIAETPDGDLLAVWFTTWVDDDIGAGEIDRRLSQVCARLPRGADEWGEAAPFFDPPGRNVTGSEVWWDRNETMFHWSGLGAAATWGALALVQRTSEDGGVTWSRPRLINPRFGLRNQVVAAAMQTSTGRLILPADAAVVDGGTAVHISDDHGDTWSDPGEGESPQDFPEGGIGRTIAGIHASVVELSDGRLLALGRGQEIRGRMPASVSEDGGVTWRYQASELDPIGGAQRLTLLNLEEENAIMVASFTPGMMIEDDSGRPRKVEGLYAALSYDDGRTWPIKRLITDDGPPRLLPEGGMRGEFVLSHKTAERYGYLASTRALDGMIHLLSSGHHYAFNYAWLTSPPPATT